MNTEPVSYTWPAGFVERMQGWLGAEASEFLAAMAKRDHGLRLNPLRGAVESLAARLPWATQPVPWCPEGLWSGEDIAVGSHLYHAMGVYYSQDPTAMAAGVLLDPQPGEWVLDLAAAPGGKTTHIAARMKNEGVLVANEIARRRAPALALNLERMGVTHALVANESPERLAGRWGGIFDAVLVDAPCSGEAIFSRDSQSAHEWSLSRIQSCAHNQRSILEQAARLVRQGGRMLYGTCTFAPEENESVIGSFLARHDDFVLADLPQLPGLHPGRPEWLATDAPGKSEDLRRCGRFWPHTGPGHGHFYALLRRLGEPPDDLPERWKGSDIPGRVLRLYQKSVESVLKTIPEEAGLILTKDDDLYVTPLPPEFWGRMQVMRPGWWVASLRHNKINLDHALAMALRPEETLTPIELTPDDARLAAYMRGGFWPDDGPEGFVLVTVEGFPLGWAKRDGKCARSRYPVHLRR